MAAEGTGNLARKAAYFTKLQGYLKEYPKCVIVHADNVGSKQMQDIRSMLRGKGLLLMGKNTMIRKAMRQLIEAGEEKYEAYLPHIVGNIGLIFTKMVDIRPIRDIINAQRIPAFAKAGAVAQANVTVYKGLTDLEPSQTAFLQVLGIATKITKSKIEILADCPVCTKGERVGSSEAALLLKLGIQPFSYGLEILVVYDDGAIITPEILDIDANAIRERFMAGVANVAAISLELGIPTLASLPHSIVNGFKNVLAISLETEYTFKEAEKIKAYLADPSAFAVAAAPAAAAAAPAKAAAAAPAAKSESASGDGDMGFDLFD